MTMLEIFGKNVHAIVDAEGQTAIPDLSSIMAKYDKMVDEVREYRQFLIKLSKHYGYQISFED